MKKRIMMIFLMNFIIMSGSVFAKTYNYPIEKPLFSIDFPDSWIVQFDTEEVSILAHSQDKEIEYNIWELPSKDVKANIKDALNDAVKDVNEIIADYVTNISFGDWKPEVINGIDFIWAEGNGKYKDGGQTVYMEVDFFSPDDKTVFVLMYWGTKEGEKKYKLEIEKIDRSIKKKKSNTSM
ncbi:MAG: hypothetical protein HQK77_12710 [Desulfobacterales bacterium]|nr:hypothetical protein [Desulfobacterales bacterium]